MPKRTTMIQLVGHQRTSNAKTVSAMLDCSVHIIGLFGFIWVGWLLIEWAGR